MGEQRDRMRSWTDRTELKRRCILGERHFLDANARLNPMRERNTGDPATPAMIQFLRAQSEKSIRTVPKL
jgi:hypothetical protein